MKRIILLGDRDDRFVTHRELGAAIAQLSDRVQLDWIGTDTADVARPADADGLWVIPGSPYRDDSAVYAAITAARASGQPFLGTCGGFQYAVIEFAKNVAGISGAGHAESDPLAPRHVVDRLACSLVGEERTVRPVRGTKVSAICGEAPFAGFHWCSYGLAPEYLNTLVDHGLVVSAYADDAGAEAIELPRHPFFVATLFQPQVGALAGRPIHPIVSAFVDAVVNG